MSSRHSHGIIQVSRRLNSPLCLETQMSTNLPYWWELTWMCLLAEWVKFWVNYPCSPKTQQLRLTGIVALSSIGAAGSGEKGWPERHALPVWGWALFLHCLLCSLPLGHHRGAFPLSRWVWCLHGKKIHFALMTTLLLKAAKKFHCFSLQTFSILLFY